MLKYEVKVDIDPLKAIAREISSEISGSSGPVRSSLHDGAKDITRFVQNNMGRNAAPVERGGRPLVDTGELQKHVASVVQDIPGGVELSAGKGAHSKSSLSYDDIVRIQSEGGPNLPAREIMILPNGSDLDNLTEKIAKGIRQVLNGR